MKEYTLVCMLSGIMYEDDYNSYQNTGEADGSFEYDPETETYIFEGEWRFVALAESQEDAIKAAEDAIEHADFGTLHEVSHDYFEVEQKTKPVKEIERD